MLLCDDGAGDGMCHPRPLNPNTRPSHSAPSLPTELLLSLQNPAFRVPSPRTRLCLGMGLKGSMMAPFRLSLSCLFVHLPLTQQRKCHKDGDQASPVIVFPCPARVHPGR